VNGTAEDAAFQNVAALPILDEATDFDSVSRSLNLLFMVSNNRALFEMEMKSMACGNIAGD
jgi:hypothetical protein